MSERHGVKARNGDTVYLYEVSDGVFACPVCGYALENMPPPYDIETFVPSREFCPCCEIQFGWDDMVGPLATSGGQRDKWEELREKWLKSGVPADEAARQLANIDTEYA